MPKELYEKKGDGRLGKVTIRGYEIWSDKTDAELMEAAGRWSEGKDHSDLDFENLWGELSEEKKKKHLDAVAFFLPEEVPEKQKGETTAEYITHSQEAEAKRQVLLQRNARSAFAATLLPTREEKIAGLLNAPATGETKARLAAIKAREQEDEARKQEAKEAARKARDQEWGTGSGGKGLSIN